MNAFPLPPLIDMPGQGEMAKTNATYFGQDMRFMIMYGGNDTIVPANETQKIYHEIFDALGVNSTLKNESIEAGVSHEVVKGDFDQMLEFIKDEDGEVPEPAPAQVAVDLVAVDLISHLANKVPVEVAIPQTLQQKINRRISMLFA